MARASTQTKKVAPQQPAAQPDKRTLKPHEVVLSPTIQSAVAIDSWGKFAGSVDLADLVTDLRERIKQVQDGDMKPIEAMLMGQAMTLETIFTNLARKAQAQEYLKQFQVNLTLALKAQAQCRATLEALAEIKNPKPVLIAKQANFAHQQQVNNGPGATDRDVRASAHAKKTMSPKNGLLEAPHGGELDTRAQSAPGRVDPAMATVD